MPPAPAAFHFWPPPWVFYGFAVTLTSVHFMLSTVFLQCVLLLLKCTVFLVLERKAKDYRYAIFIEDLQPSPFTGRHPLVFLVKEVFSRLFVYFIISSAWHSRGTPALHDTLQSEGWVFRYSAWSPGGQITQTDAGIDTHYMFIYITGVNPKPVVTVDYS